MDRVVSVLCHPYNNNIDTLTKDAIVMAVNYSLSLHLFSPLSSPPPPLSACIAIGLPDLGDLISLVGAFACCALAFIIPPCLELLTRWPTRHQSRWWPVWVVKDVAILSLGVVGFIFGTYATLVNIANYFKNHY